MSKVPLLQAQVGEFDALYIKGERFVPGAAGIGTVTEITTTGGITGGPITSTGTLSLTDTGVPGGAYVLPSISVDVKGRILSALSATIGTTGFPIYSSGVLRSLQFGPNMTASVVGNSISINAIGAGTGTVTSVATGTGLTGGPITSNGTISLATASSGAGTYPLIRDVTVDVYGRVTTVSGATVSGDDTASLRIYNPSTSVFRSIKGSGAAVVTQIGDVIDVNVAASGGGSVTSVSSGTGLTGGPITTTGTLSIANTGVIAGNYVLPYYTANAQGQLTASANSTISGTGVALYDAASHTLKSLVNGTNTTVTGTSTTIQVNGNAGTVTGIATGTGLTGGPISTSGTISLATAGAGAATYNLMRAVSVDAYGRVTNASNVTFAGSDATSPFNVYNAASGVVRAIQGTGDVTVSQAGNVLSINCVSGSGTVTSVTAGSGLSGGTITTTGTISMPDVITAGSVSYPSSITYDAKGRITSATAGSAVSNNIFYKQPAVGYTQGSSSAFYPGGNFVFGGVLVDLSGGDVTDGTTTFTVNTTGTYEVECIIRAKVVMTSTSVGAVRFNTEVLMKKDGAYIANDVKKDVFTSPAIGTNFEKSDRYHCKWAGPVSAGQVIEVTVSGVVLDAASSYQWIFGNNDIDVGCGIFIRRIN